MSRATDAPILLHAASLTQWSLLGRLAQRLRAAGERVVLSHEGPPPSAAGVEGLDAFEASDFDARAAAVVEAEVTPWVERQVPARWRDRVLGPPRYRTFLALHRGRLEAARRLVRRTRPRLLIVPEDGVAANAWLIRAVQDEGAPVLVVPYGFGSRRDFDNALAQKQRAGDLILASDEDGMRVARDHPQWVRPTASGPALLFPADYILARERLGLTLRDPWTVHGGPAQRIAAESAVMMDHYRREGLPEAKLALAGTLYCDVVHDALLADPRHRRAFEEARRIEAGAARVLVALPPSYHGERAAEAEFASFGELCAQTLGFLVSLPRTEVTVSIHPATLPADRRAIEASGALISADYVVGLIGSHDLYVTCFSSTVRWAIAAGKPVLNYDMYSFRLPDYDGVPGVFTTRTQAGFRELAQALAADEAHYLQVARRQKEVAPSWGSLDGRNFERIHALARDLAPGGRR